MASFMPSLSIIAMLRGRCSDWVWILEDLVEFLECSSSFHCTEEMEVFWIQNLWDRTLIDIRPIPFGKENPECRNASSGDSG
ncbi:hypothetical protein M413DRAFT_441528 [Hebeloma cylindrosporum]|uniref:Uncharacterized protein n=1 Tax=Hebeloma cylindrosporum TaxID=76867 RepID=A0A0C3CR97_HEBCY|nr:hypothetical protein M413DRAFT_441528 [Hebeloma cylindrosporum h7]